jgi:hypothetical protein
MSRNILAVYYAATALFVSLDYGFGINIRAAFLENTPGLRLGFYVMLFACLALIIWRPQWSTIVGTIESLGTLIALIVSMALRSMVVTDAMIESGTGFVTIQEIVNFLIAGGAAYYSYATGVRALFSQRALTPTSRSGFD